MIKFRRGERSHKELNKLNDKIIKRNEARLHSLIEILIKTFDSVDDLLHYSLEQAVKLTESEVGFILSYNKISRQVQLFAWSSTVQKLCNIEDKQDFHPLRDTSFLMDIIENKEFIVQNDCKEVFEFPDGHIDIERFMCVPVSSDDKFVALVGVGNKNEDYTKMDVLQLRLLIEAVWKKVDRQIIHERLRVSEEKYRLLYEYMSEGLVLIKLIYDQNGQAVDYKIVEANKAFQKLFNIAPKDFENIPMSRLYSGNTPYLDVFTRVMETGKPEQFDSYIKEIDKYFSVSVYTFGKDICGALFYDLTNEKKKQNEIMQISYRDALTGVYNRMYFEKEILEIGTKYKLPVSIILGDVNGLKITNDVFGHHVGDKLLKRIADIIKNSCRKTDLIARWGGDEFIILLPETGAEDAEQICKNIRKLCSKQTNLPVCPSISLGYATKADDEIGIQKTIKSAEDWMYRHKLLESKSVRSAVISSLNKTLFEKSYETEEHAQRIAAICRKTGKELDLTERMMDSLELISTLHDIGKIPISNSILSKTKPLTEKEIEEVKKHAEIGYRIAQSIPELTHISEGILSHHERWDGMGYPQKLKGTQIPLLSRIVAVADAYDSMTNPKPYRKKKTHEEALEEIKKGAGTQFDPYIVEIFLKCCRDEQDIFKEE